MLSLRSHCTAEAVGKAFAKAKYDLSILLGHKEGRGLRADLWGVLRSPAVGGEGGHYGHGGGPCGPPPFALPK